MCVWGGADGQSSLGLSNEAWVLILHLRPGDPMPSNK